MADGGATERLGQADALTMTSAQMAQARRSLQARGKRQITLRRIDRGKKIAAVLTRHIEVAN